MFGIFLILGLYNIEQAHTFVPAYRRPPQCYPTHEHDKLQSAMMKMSSKSIDRKVDGSKRTTDTKKIPKHDRTIDRRKSPALWRDDLEYSITSGAEMMSEMKHTSTIKITLSPKNHQN